MKHCNEIAYLRQLCCLGLGREILIPEFLKAVQTVIPSGNNFFIGFNQNGNPSYCLTDMSAQGMQDIATKVVPQFFTHERWSQVYEYFKCYPTITDHNVLDDQFFQTDLYHLMWQPWGLHHFILAPVMVNKRIAGLFFLFRPYEVHPFSASEQALCLRISSYIAHALQAQNLTNAEFSQNGLSSMVIMNNQGRIIHMNASAKRLLNLLGENDFNETTQANPIVLQALFSKLWADLNLKNDDALPPTITHANLNGRFIFRAYWLDHSLNEQDGLIGITIEHQEPIILKITRNLQFLPLSVKEKEVALMCAQKYSQDKIGRSLNIKLTTVKFHVKNIYSKLGIAGREQLLEKLLV